MATTFRSSLGNILSSSNGVSNSFSKNMEVNNIKTTLPGLITNQEEKKTILSAFSGLDLALNADGKVITQPKEASASMKLIQTKKDEKEQIKKLEENSMQNAIFAIKPKNKKTPTALTQAVNGFENEVTDADSYITQGQRKKGRKAQLSRKAKNRKLKGQNRGENYEEKITSKSSRSAKKALRKEMYKRIY